MGRAFLCFGNAFRLVLLRSVPEKQVKKGFGPTSRRSSRSRLRSIILLTKAHSVLKEARLQTRSLKGKGLKIQRAPGEGRSKAHLEQGTSWQWWEESRCLSTQREGSLWGTGETREGGGGNRGAGKQLQTQGNNTQTETGLYSVKICKYVWSIEIGLTLPPHAEQQLRELSSHISPVIIYW